MGILIHVVISDLHRRCPVDSIQDHRGSIPLPALCDAAHDSLRNLRHIHLLKLCLAVRAVPAVSASILPEIPQDILSQAVVRKAVERHLFQAIPVSLRNDRSRHIVKLLIIPVVVDKHLVCHHISAAVEQQAVRRFPVTPRAAGFLIIALHVLRHIVVDHKADVRLVNSHAEGIGCHHDLRPVEDEILLILLSLAVGKSRMVSRDGESVLHQLLRHLLHEFSRQAVNDAALTGVFFDICLYRRILVLRALDLEIEVWTVESCCRHHRILEFQEIDNIIPNLRRRRCREGADYRTFRECTQKFFYF